MADKPFTLAPTEPPDLTINRFPVPEPDVVNNVLFNRNGWTTLAKVATDRLAKEKAERLAKRDCYTMTPIPAPEFDTDET